ncbi:MAG: RNA 2',3'-cyclic phosphodiesterase [Chloroflexi bacterium]|nr:RNA 2',3'-cyclic phosphodiesterase [Chloroflexota bacterium]
MEPVRSFIAVELPEEVRAKLATLQARLKLGEQFGVKWVAPAGIHLTLKFLGNVEAERISEIAGAMTEAARGIPPFHLEIKGLGAFPSLKRVQVVWAGLEGDLDRLSQLQQNIELALALLGFAEEERPFTPHLTLARVRPQVLPEERLRLGQAIASTTFAGGPIQVDAVNLMQSQLTRTGAIYTRLSSVALGG